MNYVEEQNRICDAIEAFLKKYIIPSATALEVLVEMQDVQEIYDFIEPLLYIGYFRYRPQLFTNSDRQMKYYKFNRDELHDDERLFHFDAYVDFQNLLTFMTNDDVFKYIRWAYKSVQKRMTMTPMPSLEIQCCLTSYRRDIEDMHFTTNLWSGTWAFRTACSENYHNRSCPETFDDVKEIVKMRKMYLTTNKNNVMDFISLIVKHPDSEEWSIFIRNRDQTGLPFIEINRTDEGLIQYVVTQDELPKENKDSCFLYLSGRRDKINVESFADELNYYEALCTNDWAIQSSENDLFSDADDEEKEDDFYSFNRTPPREPWSIYNRFNTPQVPVAPPKVECEALASQDNLQILLHVGRGISNSGNNCFIIAVIQSLFCTVGLNTLIDQLKERQQSPICHALLCVARKYKAAPVNSVVDIRAEAVCFRKNNPEFRAGSQEDAAEFWSELIDPDRASADTISGCFDVSPFAILSEKTIGHTDSNPRFEACVSRRTETLYSLQMEVHTIEKTSLTFGDILENWQTQQREIFSQDNWWYCERCGAKVPSMSVTTYPNMPRILLVQLLLFPYGRPKVDTSINIESLKKIRQ